MNEHATRAIERARLAENAADIAFFSAYMYDAVEALNESVRKQEFDAPRAFTAILDACAAQYGRNLKHPIDAAAVPGAQWGGKSDD